MSPSHASHNFFMTGLLGGKAESVPHWRRFPTRRSLRRACQQAASAAASGTGAQSAAAAVAAAATTTKTTMTVNRIGNSSVLVTWNIARAADQKVVAIERLIIECGYPMVIAIQEIGDADFGANSTLAAVLAKHHYVPFHRYRNNDSSNTHGGTALLVRDNVSAEPYMWPQAEKWSAECETVSIVVHHPGGDFIISSVYVHGGSQDVDGFRRLMASVRDDQIVLGDLNAQLPGSRVGPIAEHFKQRGIVLEQHIRDRNVMYPTPTGPTRITSECVDIVDGEQVTVQLGSINDHILVGQQVFARLAHAESESLVLPRDYWPSDHLPLIWSAEIAFRGDNKLNWCHRVAWHSVTDEHKARYEAVFIEEVQRARERRQLDMIEVERAFLIAARKALPHTRPRTLRDGLFWIEAAKRHVEEAADEFGSAAHAQHTKSHAEARRRTLAEKASVSSDPSSVWSFVSRYFAFKKEFALKPPLRFVDEEGDVVETVTDPNDRVNKLGAGYASVSANPRGVDAQQKLAEVAATIPPPGRRSGKGAWQRISVTELRASVSSLNPGKCADFLGIKAEHVRLLSDDGLKYMIPFVDRCLSRACMPSHWLTAVVSPVPKRNRDLSLPKSWRPVSVTAILCRLCETIIHNRISHVLEHGGHRLGRSQFGFRRGVSGTLPLSGLSMFICDGRRQKTMVKEWDAYDVEQRKNVKQGDQARTTAQFREHVSLLISIDGSEAFCRALPAKAIRKLLSMGCVNEARWIAAFLTDRTLKVREGDAVSQAYPLARGVPQGSILGPLLWSLVIDELIEHCEAVCRKPIPGCVVIPIVFADDVNFVVRGLNPTSMVVQANTMLKAVRTWATENGVPMAKLQASWITGSNSTEWAAKWGGDDGYIRYDDNIKCLPKLQPIKLLGVTYDPAFTFKPHVDAVLETCERLLRLLTAMSGVVKAEKLAVIYQGLILSRMLFAVDAWYPYTSAPERARLQSMHYRACCVITGCIAGSDAASVCYEAGFRMLPELVRDEIVTVADRLRRMPDGCPSNTASAVCFGVEWVARLFRDGVMPTADLRPVICKDGSTRARAAAVWPKPDWKRADDPDTPQRDSLRDVGRTLIVGAPHERGRDPRDAHPALRPMPRPHPFPPHELAVFDERVRFVVDPPGGLTKLDKPVETWTKEECQPFEQANEERMQQLVDKYGAGSTFIFTDGSRDELERKCAGTFVVSRGSDPTVKDAVIHASHVLAGPIACVYTAELRSIDAALAWVLENRQQVFNWRPKNLVIVTDSKSSLESLRTTWVRRIGFLEQTVTRKLYDLATSGITVALAFVFSHVGGCKGNADADVRAQKACSRWGGRWCDDLWNIDTTRHVLNERHKLVDLGLNDGDRFRFSSMPAFLQCRPSEPLPRSMSRYHEKLVYRARVGMITAAGGTSHGQLDKCPFCARDDMLGRGGLTVEHLAECAAEHTDPPIELSTNELWTDPAKSAKALELISRLARATPVTSKASQQSPGLLLTQ